MPCEYIEGGLDLSLRKYVITRLVKEIKKSGVKFDAIVFRGMSGALVAPSVADKMKKPLVVCRKKDNHHSSYSVEYIEGWFENFIIIDDLISSGETILTILKMIDDEWDERNDEAKQYLKKEVARPKCVGIFLYHTYSRRSEFEFSEYVKSCKDIGCEKDMEFLYEESIPIIGFHFNSMK